MILSLILVSILCFCFADCNKIYNNANSKDDVYELLLYKTLNDNSAIWLFGSIHIGTEDIYSLSDYIESDFSSSNILVVECDIMALMQNIETSTTILIKFYIKTVLQFLITFPLIYTKKQKKKSF